MKRARKRARDAGVSLRRVGYAAVLATIGVLPACGGGSDAPAAADTSAPTPASALAISSFTPSSAAPGATITVTGNSLNTVTGAKVGNVNASFVIDSATQLRLTVPQGAQSSRIELSNASRAVMSAQDLTVTAVAQLSAVSPATVLPPATINLTGSNFDLIQQVRLNNTVLTITARTATTMTLTVPAGATTGVLTLVGTDNVARASTQTVTVLGPLGVTSFAPTTAVRGGSVTITGTNLDRAASVLFTGGASANIASRTGSTSITVTVPNTATTGVLTVVGNQNTQADRVTTATSLTVANAISVNAATVYNAVAGGSVTVTGTGLDAVTSVTVSGNAATIGARSDTQITFTVPQGVACGGIVFTSLAQPAVPAGTVVVGAGCPVRSAGVEFAQVLSQAQGDPYQRLVPRKETWVRAYVVTETANLAAPVVRVTAFNGNTQLGSVTMTGPATLPVVANNAAVPNAIRYDEMQSFNAQLPADWVTSGLRVRVEIDTAQRYGATVTADATPVVGSNTRLDLVLVPLVSGSNVPQMPTVADVLDEVTRRMPIPRENITVTVRAPYTLSSTNDGVDTSTEWSNTLQELELLRRSEAPTKHYYGVVRPIVGAGIAGIGYVNSINSNSPLLASLGWDASRTSWRRTMSHELGHNFSRFHAPCGNVAGPDANYPYALGALSATPLFDPLLDDVVSPVNGSDIMGYCNGSWFSDYNYREVQRFLEARPQTQTLVQSASVQSELLVVSGSVGLDGMSLRPIKRARGTPGTAAAGEYTVRLELENGESMEVPVEAVMVDHAMPPEKHFFAKVAHPGAVARMELMRGNVVVPARANDRVTAQAVQGTKSGSGKTGVTQASASPSINWQQRGAILELSWDSAATPYVSVTHVTRDGERKVLGVDLTGGTARLDVSALPSGGEFEFSLSDGLNAQLLVVQR